MLSKIMLTVGLTQHPKLHALARAAGVSWPSALGYLIALWEGVMIQREGGVLGGWGVGDVERVCRWRGGAGVWSSALISTKWLDPLENGEYGVHDWKEHQGDIIEERLDESSRKSIYRAHKKGKHSKHCKPNCDMGQSGTSPAVSAAPSPSLPVPPRPFPSHPSQGSGVRDTDSPPPSAAPGTEDRDREVDRTVAAFGFCSGPKVAAKRIAIIDLLRIGVSHATIRETAGKQPKLTFFQIVNQLEKDQRRAPEFNPSSPPRRITCRRCNDDHRVVDHSRTTPQQTAWKPCPDCSPPADSKATG